MIRLITVAILTMLACVPIAAATPAKAPTLTTAQAERRAEMAKKILLSRQAGWAKQAQKERAALKYVSIVETERSERIWRYVACASVSVAVLSLVLFFALRGRAIAMAERRTKIRAMVVEAVDYAGQMKHLAAMTPQEAEKTALAYLNKLRRSPEFRVRGKVEPSWSMRIRAEVARRKGRI